MKVNSKDLTIDLDDAQKRLTKTQTIMPIVIQKSYKFEIFIIADKYNLR